MRLPNMMAEASQMISLVAEAQRTNYWTSVQTVGETKRKKAQEKKRWAKIRRKQGR